jgi:hypothetical protein
MDIPSYCFGKKVLAIYRVPASNPYFIPSKYEVIETKKPEYHYSGFRINKELSLFRRRVNCLVQGAL